jgi:DNA polymerase elongation subunit (family B)
MILDIEQRDKDVIISYYDAEGKVAFKRYNIDKFRNWYVCDPKDRGASTKYKNWDGRPIKEGPARQFNKFSLVYFLDGLPERDKEEIFAYNMPRTYFVDIETEIVDGFPRAEDWEFKYHKFKSEYDMVYTFIYKFLPKFPMMTGWNFINYDWQYITNRCKRLQIDITEAAITKKLDRNDGRPLHMGILDYMQLYDKYDRSVKVKESNSLDYVSGQVLDVKKIKYTGSLQDLYRDNFTKYVYYNVVDSVLVYYIDQQLKSMEVIMTLASITKMPLYKAASPVAVTESLMARKLSEMDMRIGQEYKEDGEKNGQYTGAFVKVPGVGFYEGVSAFDFASLYPSIMRQFNISPDAYIEQVYKDQIAERREDKSVIVCDNGVVYKKEDSILKKILSDLYDQRKQYKKTSYDYFSKADNLKKKIKLLS